MKILSKNIKECNIFILLLVAVLIIGGSAYTSYAIFTTKVEGESSIEIGVGCNTFDVDLISTSLGKDSSNANEPILLDNMIPVVYDGCSNWLKADTSKNWYNYDKKTWANAVTVSEESREAYLNAEPGTVIEMSDINTMWVWIPRYKYTIFNANMSGNETAEEQEIEIVFESGATTTGTVSCVDSINNSDGTSEVCTDSTYGEVTNDSSTYTHPAFTFGDDELTGFWFGKFENSIDENNNIIIKPDVLSWDKATTSIAFEYYSRSMELANNIYGFSSTATAYNATGELTGDTNNFDTHMIKNMEWGAVTYLTQSKYGRCTDGVCSEVYANNSVRIDGSNFYDTYTGRSRGGYAGDGSINYKAYGSYSYDDYLISGDNTKGNRAKGLGVGASTTGNTYGIYDMSGGLWERVMGNMVDANGNFNVGDSGTWTTDLTPYPKYYDCYSYGDSDADLTAFKRGKLGDATKEVLLNSSGDRNSWYSDHSRFTFTTSPWLYRGAHASSGRSIGIFAFHPITGGYNYASSSRVSLVITT